MAFFLQEGEQVDRVDPESGTRQLDLLEDEGVALDRSRVVRLLEPDPAPNSLCLVRRREPAQALSKLADLDLQSFVDGRSRGSSTARR